MMVRQAPEPRGDFSLPVGIVNLPAGGPLYSLQGTGEVVALNEERQKLDIQLINLRTVPLDFPVDLRQCHRTGIDGMLRPMRDPLLTLLLKRHLETGELDFLRGKTLAVRCGQIAMSFRVSGRWIHLSPGRAADVAIRGDPGDLIALATGRADADALFFQRRLVVTGDTELALRLRNVMESLPPPWPVALLRRLSPPRRG